VVNALETIITLLATMVALMILLKLLFAEMDGRTSVKKGNVKYFIDITKGFKYNRAIHMVLLLVFCFVLFTDVNLFSIEGFLVFGVFLCIGIISDIVSQFVYYKYANARFKDNIQEAIQLMEEIKREGEKEQFEGDLITYPKRFSFNEIVTDNLYEDDHTVFVTVDGGEFVNDLDTLPKVTYVIDAFEQSTNYILKDKLVKIVAFTKEQLLPFKKERLDVVVSKDTNFNFAFTDVFRVLKEDGTYMLYQAASDHLFEIRTMFFPMQFTAPWNAMICERKLNDAGFVVLSHGEDKGQIRFRTMSAFMHYFKTLADKIENIEMYINQLALIYRQIKSQGYFIVTTNKFYIIAKKRTGLLDK